METARALLARALTSLTYIGSFEESPTDPKRVSANFLQPWTTFDEDISVALRMIDFDAKVSFTDSPKNDRNITASEIGLKTRSFN